MLFYRLFIEEYFLENVWKNAIQRLKDTAPDVPESTISFYVNEFKNLKNQKSLQQFRDAVELLEIEVNSQYPLNDISAYKTFEDLEKVVDYLKSVYAKPPKDFSLDIQIEGAKTIYKDDEVEIYRGLTRKACIEYSTGYSWCIGRPGEGNLYYVYRFKEHEPTFYFVKDLKKIEKENFLSLRQIGASVGVDSFKDKYHFFVIQVPKNGRQRDVYFVTSAKNDGDKQMSWREIVSICPALSDKQDLFEYVPLNELERKAKDKFYNKPLPSLKEFANLSYEEKQIFLAVRVNSLRDLPDEYFFLLPDSLKKEFIAMGLGLTPRMYMYIIKDKDLNKYREKVGDTILTADNQHVRISPAMVYYFLGLNLDNYVNIKYKERFESVLLKLINFDKYDDKDYWKKYIKYIEYVENKCYFLGNINEQRIKQIASVLKESQIRDSILLMISEKFGENFVEEEDYISYLKDMKDRDIVNLLMCSKNPKRIVKVLKQNEYNHFLHSLETKEVLNLVKSLRNDSEFLDWIASNLSESQINYEVLLIILYECGEETLEREMYKSLLHSVKTHDLSSLIEYAKSNRWIASNIDESQIDNYILHLVFKTFGEEFLNQKKYKSFLHNLEPSKIDHLFYLSDKRFLNWAALNLKDSQISFNVLYNVFSKCGKEVLEQRRYKSRLDEFPIYQIVNLIYFSPNRDWIALNLDKSKVDKYLLGIILYNCSSEVVNEYKKYFNLD